MHPATEAERLASLVRKEGLGRDPEAQAVEDCACLCFSRGTLAEFSGRVETEQSAPTRVGPGKDVAPGPGDARHGDPQTPEEVRAQVTAASRTRRNEGRETGPAGYPRPHGGWEANAWRRRRDSNPRTP
ncbi:MAG: hypothetical protein U5L11_06240 [Arhodomonas sp.]|nr:hypothetical protein [Arhodomonas sp.]